MRSRLEAVGEAEGAEVGLLDEVIGVRRALGEPEGEAIERVEMKQRLSLQVGEGLYHGGSRLRDHASRKPH